MEQTETTYVPFAVPAYLFREQVETLRQVITAQDAVILALRAENADLHRLLGLHGETVALEQKIEEYEEGRE
jgi:hypothetical protein